MKKSDFIIYRFAHIGAFLFIVMASSPAYAWDPDKDLSKTQSFISEINQACDDDFGTMKETLSAFSCSGCHTSPPSLNSAADTFRSFKDVSGYCTIASNTGGGGTGGGGTGGGDTGGGGTGGGDTGGGDTGGGDTGTTDPAMSDDRHGDRRHGRDGKHHDRGYGDDSGHGRDHGDDKGAGHREHDKGKKGKKHG